MPMVAAIGTPMMRAPTPTTTPLNRPTMVLP